MKWFKGAEIDDILSASAIEELGPIAWNKLRDSFPSFVSILTATENSLRLAGLSQSQISSLYNRPRSVASVRHLLDSKNIQLVTLDDASYPALLREIPDPPLWLFVRGDISILKHPCLTVVGTRKPTAYAKTAVNNLLTRELCRNVCTISGLAYGIDKEAHMAALRHGGKTAAVLAGGLDSIYPAEHTNLSEQIIKQGGALISEYPPLMRPKPYRFPIRNRIVAGLSPATLVVESLLKSGTMTTARSAIEYNRDIFAVPGDINRSSSEASNYLIKCGATLIDNNSQLLDYYGINPNKSAVVVDKELQKLLDLLSDGPLTVDELTITTGCSYELLLPQLRQLQSSGLLVKISAESFQLKK